MDLQIVDPFTHVGTEYGLQEMNYVGVTDTSFIGCTGGLGTLSNGVLVCDNVNGTFTPVVATMVIISMG